MTTTTAVLPQLTRDILEDFGVLKPAKIPSVDALGQAIHERGGRWKLEQGETLTAAAVSLSGNTFDHAADDPRLALAEAFAQCLLQEPRQAEMFGGDGTLSDEARSRLERFRENMNKPAPDEDETEEASE